MSEKLSLNSVDVIVTTADGIKRLSLIGENVAKVTTEALAMAGALPKDGTVSQYVKSSL